MTQEITPTETVVPNKPLVKKNYWFYRDYRCILSFLISGVILSLTGNITFFAMSHILATLFWDWWFFSYWKVRESSVVPAEYFQLGNLTPEQMDYYATFIVKMRRITFGIASFVALVVCFVKTDPFIREVTLPITYAVLLYLIGVSAEWLGKIKYPYPAQGQNWEKLPYPMNVINSSYYNASSTNKINNPFA